MLRFSALLVGLLLAVLPGPAAAFTVFAAASTSPLLESLAQQYRAQGGDFRGVYAASSALAKQIERGAPADLFISASRSWVDYLEGKGRLVPGSRQALFRNSLVLVVPASRAAVAPLHDLSTLPAVLGDGRLAVGDPDFVPAGLYARQALDFYGLWSRLGSRLARAANARAALALVESGEAAAGIVYATAALNNPKVRQIFAFPAASHAPIVYELARPKDSDSKAAEKFLSFLSRPPARAQIIGFGFLPLD